MTEAPTLLQTLRAPLIVLALVGSIATAGIIFAVEVLHVTAYDVLVVAPSEVIGVLMM